MAGLTPPSLFSTLDEVSIASKAAAATTIITVLHCTTVTVRRIFDPGPPTRMEDSRSSGSIENHASKKSLVRYDCLIGPTATGLESYR